MSAFDGGARNGGAQQDGGRGRSGGEPRFRRLYVAGKLSYASASARASGTPDVSEIEALFRVLRQSASPDVAAAIERAVHDGTDRELCRINVLDFATRRGLDEEPTIAGFLHAARLGIFELSWNVLCPGCGGVLDEGATLKTIDRDEYGCALCAAGYEPTLDEMVEVTFTVSPRVRRIAAHDPDTLPEAEYYRQIFWSSGVDLPESLGDSVAEFTARFDRAARRRKGDAVAATARSVHHRVRPGDARRAVSRRQGRADARAQNSLHGLQQAQAADRDDRAAAGAVAAVAREPHRSPRASRRSGSPATRSTICSASASPSSPPSGS